MIIKIAQANLDFRSMRIKHGGLLVIIIWSRILLGLCVNISLTTQYLGRLQKFIHETYTKFFLFYASPAFSNFNIAAIGMYSVLAISTLGCYFSRKASTRKVGIIITLIHYSVNPLIIRYLITIGTSCQQSAVYPIVQTLCFVSVLSNFLMMHFFKLICHSSQPKN